MGRRRCGLPESPRLLIPTDELLTRAMSYRHETARAPHLVPVVPVVQRAMLKRRRRVPQRFRPETPGHVQ